MPTPAPTTSASITGRSAPRRRPELSQACAGPPPRLAAKLDTEPELHGVSDQVRSETMGARRKPRDKKIVAAVAPRAAPAVVGRRGQEPNVLLTLAARDSPGRRRTPRAEPNVLLTLAARDGRHRAFARRRSICLPRRRVSHVASPLALLPTTHTAAFGPAGYRASHDPVSRFVPRSAAPAKLAPSPSAHLARSAWKIAT